MMHGSHLMCTRVGEQAYIACCVGQTINQTAEQSAYKLYNYFSLTLGSTLTDLSLSLLDILQCSTSAICNMVHEPCFCKSVIFSCALALESSWKRLCSGAWVPAAPLTSHAAYEVQKRQRRNLYLSTVLSSVTYHHISEWLWTALRVCNSRPLALGQGSKQPQIVQHKAEQMKCEPGLLTMKSDCNMCSLISFKLNFKLQSCAIASMQGNSDISWSTLLAWET